MLLNGSDWVSVPEMVDIKLGELEINPSKMKGIKVETRTGYFKTSWNTDEIKPKIS